MNVRKTRAAHGDLLRIYLYLVARNPDAAKVTLARFDQTFQLLTRHPLLGRARSTLGAGIRAIVSGQHVIFYVVAPDAITILRVIDGRMDVEAEFRR
jgi:toxin ParE1/3/4